MAVNGVVIRVGQTWCTRDGRTADIEATNDPLVHLGQHYPIRATIGVGTFRYTTTGLLTVWSQEGADLVELIEDAPGAEPEPAAIEAPTTASAPDLLDAAAGHMRDRAATYDKPEGERSMAQTVAVFNQFHGTALTEAQGWHFMQILKDVRLFANPTNPHRDSVEDGVAYSALKGEAILKGGV